jgi:hypothetical protein
VSPGRLSAALFIGALLVFSGCGSDKKGKPIPARDANQLIALIQKADQQSADGTCGGASAKVREAQGVADQLPRSVDKDVRRGLTDGLDRLLSLIQGECQRPQKTQTDTTPTETQPTVTTETQTTQTETQPTQTQPTQTDTTLTTTTPTTTTPTQTNTGTGTTTSGTGGTPPGQSNGAGGADG